MGKILILRNDHLGDLILTTGLIRNLVSAGHQVDICCKASWQPVFECAPNTKAFGFGHNEVPHADSTLLLSRWISARKYDHLLIPYRDSALLLASLLSGVRFRWAQMAGVQGLFTLHHGLRSDIKRNPRHMADVWLDFARALKIEVDNGKPELFITSAEQKAIELRISEKLKHPDYLVIHPFHGRSSCNWHIKEYVKLARSLSEKLNLPIVFTGLYRERLELEQYTSELREVSYWNSCGELELREFFSLIAGSRLVICSSTGALHISSALNVPSVSLFCPHPFVGPELWRSYSRNSITLSPPPAACPRFRETNIQHCGFCNTLHQLDVTAAAIKILAEDSCH